MAEPNTTYTEEELDEIIALLNNELTKPVVSTPATSDQPLDP